MHEASKTQSDNIRDNKIHINIALGGQSRYNVNSSKENQALRSSIWFSGAFNEQTVCEADEGVRSTSLRVWAKEREADEGVRSTGLRVWAKEREADEGVRSTSLRVWGIIS